MEWIISIIVIFFLVRIIQVKRKLKQEQVKDMMAFLQDSLYRPPQK